jgi:hypothetical protein
MYKAPIVLLTLWRRVPAHVGGDIYGALSLGKRAGTLHYDGYAGQSTVDLND